MKLLLANREGVIYEHPELEAAAFNGREYVVPGAEELIPLPPGSRLFTMPERLPVGFSPDTGDFTPVERFDSGEGEFQPWAVSAFMPPAYLRLLLPAYSRLEGAPPLTQWAYTAAAGGAEEIFTAGMRVDFSERWNPDNFDDRELVKRVEQRLREEADNRLLQHLSHCATQYHCFAAKNYFLGRWEAGLPVAGKCNASCLGCLSLQTGETPSSHQRISFTPTPEEIAGVAVPHLERGDDPLVSFGQGCEGEPLTEWELIAAAIELIRSRTERGTIHLNTNGSVPGAVPRLAGAGLNSVRISLNSARKVNYHRYFRPEDYSLEDVFQFISESKREGLFVHINLLVFPGFSDTQAEIEAFNRLRDETGFDLVQLKNLNIDPDLYLREMIIESPPLGMREMVDILKRVNPGLQFGYFNLQRDRFQPGAAVK